MGQDWLPSLRDLKTLMTALLVGVGLRQSRVGFLVQRKKNVRTRFELRPTFKSNMLTTDTSIHVKPKTSYIHCHLYETSKKLTKALDI